VTGTKSSRTEELRRAVLRSALGLFLVSPYLIWLAEIPDWSSPRLAEWLPAWRYAGTQSLLSAVLSCACGFVLFRALQSWRRRDAGEALLLFPNVIPPLFLVMAMLSVVTPWMAFPYGGGAVIAAHVLLNSGLVAVALDRLVQGKIGGMAETAWVMGAGPLQFWRSVAWPLLRADFACIFLFVFSLCFTSFSIPLLLSGERAVTLEVAIYDAIRTEGRWDKAVLLALLQSAMLLALAWLLPQPFWPRREGRASLDLLAWPRLRLLVAAPAVLLSAGWFFGLAGGLHGGFDAHALGAFPAAALATAALGVSVGSLHLLLFLLVAFVLPHARLDRFLNGYLAPSPAITGFGLLLIPLESETASFIRLALALSLISFPLLYRWIVHSALASLKQQTAVARSLGAGWPYILFEIVWPQAGPACLRACGLAAVWACGDFALSGILMGADFSIPLLMQDLLNNYRFEQASLLLLPLVAIALGVYFLFVKAGRYVFG
jgi:thiamine transport system permease protein